MDERLLLVEDDASIREIVSIGLTTAGFRLVTATDGSDGLARARTGGFDAVILDVMLPSMDGFEVCREIRKLSRVPVVMLTARADLGLGPTAAAGAPGRARERSPSTDRTGRRK